MLKGTSHKHRDDRYKGTTLPTAVLERHPTLDALGYDTPAFKENPYYKVIQWLYRGGKVSACECESVCARVCAGCYDLSCWCCPG